MWLRNIIITSPIGVVRNDYYTVCDEFDILDNNIGPRLIMIIMKLISYISKTTHTVMILHSTGGPG